MSDPDKEPIYQNYSQTTIKRPKSFCLPQKSSQNLPTNELFTYISCVDKLILSPTQILNHFMCIYNSNGQLVLKVLKSDDRIFLLKDLHDRTLWTIQIIKNCWPFRPKEAHVQDVSKGWTVGSVIAHRSLFSCQEKQMLLNSISLETGINIVKAPHGGGRQSHHWPFLQTFCCGCYSWFCCCFFDGYVDFHINSFNRRVGSIRMSADDTSIIFPLASDLDMRITLVAGAVLLMNN